MKVYIVFETMYHTEHRVYAVFKNADDALDVVKDLRASSAPAFTYWVEEYEVQE